MDDNILEFIIFENEGRKNMKKCKYCKSDIDENAKICPNCHKKQGPHIVRWAFLAIILIIVVAIATGGDSKKNWYKKNILRVRWLHIKM